MDAMRISQLAERSGVPATTLRFYDGAGLLPAGRTASGYRVYGEAAVERLELIAAGKRLGLPLEEIGELLGVWERGVCADVRADLRPRIAARIAESGQRAAELAAFTALLHRALGHLDALPDRPGRCDAECGCTAAPGPHSGRPGQEGGSPGPHAGSPGPHAGSPGAHAAPPGPEAEPWRSAPAVACSLSGADMAARTAAWREAVGDAAPAPVPGGVRLTLPADRTAGVAALAAAEQECCPFLDFRLHLDGRALHLEVRAPHDGLSLLAELFGGPYRDASAPAS